ncbi:hypothetical protein [Marinoscillum pacificum]|uniref:hypothetical protein n=1 Tax=Marinoscillum pacificum TaxID=392723 RepID=UPI002157B45E|nr:hypothetical protein [Marinoscillum pacificum]
MTLSRIAEFILIVIFSLLIIFHVLILTSVIPYDIVWGSRLSSHEDMITFEAISLSLNGAFLWIILMHAQFIKPVLSSKVSRVLLWVMMGLFILNTLGNLVSENDFEKVAFTPVTILLSICLFLLAKTKKHSTATN